MTIKDYFDSYADKRSIDTVDTRSYIQKLINKRLQLMVTIGKRTLKNFTNNPKG